MEVSARYDSMEALLRALEDDPAIAEKRRRESLRRLAELKDIHKGKRGFIIGNGPSLKQTDLSRLKDEITFGLNRIYMMFPQLGFGTTYFVSVNDLVIELSRLSPAPL